MRELIEPVLADVIPLAVVQQTPVLAQVDGDDGDDGGEFAPMMRETCQLIELRFASATAATRAWLALAAKRFSSRLLLDVVQVLVPVRVIGELEGDLLDVATQVDAEVLTRIW
jgi:hypothetical protein